MARQLQPLRAVKCTLVAIFWTLSLFVAHSALAVDESVIWVNTLKIQEADKVKNLLPGKSCTVFLSGGGIETSQVDAHINKKLDGTLGIEISKKYKKPEIAKKTLEQLTLLAEVFKELKVTEFQLPQILCQKDEETVCFAFAEGADVQSINDNKNYAAALRDSIWKRYMRARDSVEKKLDKAGFQTWIDGWAEGTVSKKGMWKSQLLNFEIHPHNVYYNPKTKIFTIVDIDASDDADWDDPD